MILCKLKKEMKDQFESNAFGNEIRKLRVNNGQTLSRTFITYLKVEKDQEIKLNKLTNKGNETKMKEKLEKIANKLIESKFDVLNFYKKVKIDIGDPSNIMRFRPKPSDYQNYDSYGTLVVLHDLEKVISQEKLYDFNGRFIEKIKYKDVISLIKNSNKPEFIVLATDFMDINY